MFKITWKTSEKVWRKIIKTWGTLPILSLLDMIPETLAAILDMKVTLRVKARWRHDKPISIYFLCSFFYSFLESLYTYPRLALKSQPIWLNVLNKEVEGVLPTWLDKEAFQFVGGLFEQSEFSWKLIQILCWKISSTYIQASPNWIYRLISKVLKQQI